MARKNYPDEFKRDAVALYRDTAGATITQIAAELGIGCQAAVGAEDRSDTETRVVEAFTEHLDVDDAINMVVAQAFDHGVLRVVVHVAAVSTARYPHSV